MKLEKQSLLILVGWAAQPTIESMHLFSHVQKLGFLALNR